MLAVVGMTALSEACDFVIKCCWGCTGWGVCKNKIRCSGLGVAQPGNFCHCCGNYMKGQGRAEFQFMGQTCTEKNMPQEDPLHVHCCFYMVLH